MSAYSDEDRERARKLAKRIGTGPASARLGIARSTIVMWCRAAGSPIPTRQKAPPEIVAAALRLSDEIGNALAAPALGLHPATIGNWRSANDSAALRRGRPKRREIECKCWWCGDDLAVPGLCGPECRADYIADAAEEAARGAGHEPTE